MSPNPFYFNFQLKLVGCCDLRGTLSIALHKGDNFGSVMIKQRVRLGAPQIESRRRCLGKIHLGHASLPLRGALEARRISQGRGARKLARAYTDGSGKPTGSKKKKTRINKVVLNPKIEEV